jgi:hypothetical protein
MKIKISELKLRDVVSLSNEIAGYMTATVYDIKDEIVYLWRPYVATSDFSTTSGVIPYIGIETVKLWSGENREVIILERKDVQ